MSTASCTNLLFTVSNATCARALSKIVLRVCWFLWLCAGVGAAQNPPATGKRVVPPIAGRPTNFSFIEGKYTLDVSAAPTELHVEEPIRLEIRIAGAGPREGEPDRKHIRNLFPESWNDDFYVQEMRDEHKVLRDEKTWLFVYRLKPKHVRVKAIDGIRLVYYDAAFGAKGYITIPADRIALTVTAKPDTPSDVTLDVPAVPESFYAAAGRDVLAVPQTWTGPTPLEIGLFLGLTPLLCLFGGIVYRRFWPDEPVAAQRFRASAAERARARLKADETVWHVVERYLAERLDFAAVDAVPDEVAEFLRRHGFALSVCEQARAFLDACDGFRYSVPSPSANRLAEDAATLIDLLEADPCLRS